MLESREEYQNAHHGLSCNVSCHLSNVQGGGKFAEVVDDSTKLSDHVHGVERSSLDHGLEQLVHVSEMLLLVPYRLFSLKGCGKFDALGIAPILGQFDLKMPYLLLPLFDFRLFGG